MQRGSLVLGSSVGQPQLEDSIQLMLLGVIVTQGNLATSRVICDPTYSPRELAELCARHTPRVDAVAYRIFKRVIDLTLCIIFLPLAALVLILISFFVMLSARMPVFYKQERIGQNGSAFTLYKFRTMRIDGAQVLADWFVRHPEALSEWNTAHKLKVDPRITRGGRFLRETSLDELPQLLNVLRGQMSLVGPRPVVEAELYKYGSQVGYYLAAVPGLTGLWQVSGRCNVSYNDRVQMDSRYVQNWTLWSDIKILLRTPLCVFRRDGAC